MTTEIPPDTERRLGNLEGQVTQINSRLGDMLTLYERLDAKIDTRFAAIDAKIDDRFAAIDARFIAMDAKNDSRFAAIDARFIAMDAKNDSRFSEMDAKNDARFAAMEAKIDSLRNIILFASVGIIGTLIAAIATFALTA